MQLFVSLIHAFTPGASSLFSLCMMAIVTPDGLTGLDASHESLDMVQVQPFLQQPIGMALYEWKDGKIGAVCMQGGEPCSCSLLSPSWVLALCDHVTFFVEDLLPSGGLASIIGSSKSLPQTDNILPVSQMCSIPICVEGGRPGGVLL